MRALRVDISQVSQTLWRAYINEFEIHVSAETRNGLLEEVTQEAAEKFGFRDFLVVVNQV